MRMMPKVEGRRAGWVMALGSLAVVTAARAVSACPMCKELLFEPGQITQRLSMASGYAIAIGLMLGMPIVLVGGVAVLLIRARRRSADRAAIEPSPSPRGG